MRRRAQATVEMLIVTAIGVAVLIMLIDLLGGHLSTIRGISHTDVTRAALDDLDAAGREVVQAGIGSQKLATITLPYGAEQMRVSANTLLITYQSGESAHKALSYPAMGSAQLSAGKNYIDVVSTAAGVCFGNQSAC